jgi:hypothetical protein
VASVVDNTPKCVDKPLPLWTVCLKYTKLRRKLMKPHHHMWQVPCMGGYMWSSGLPRDPVG